MGEDGSPQPGSTAGAGGASSTAQRRDGLLKALRAADREVGEYRNRVLAQAVRRVAYAADDAPQRLRDDLAARSVECEDLVKKQSPEAAERLSELVARLEEFDRGAAREVRSLVACAERASALLLAATTELEATGVPAFLRSLAELEALVKAGSTVRGSHRLKLCLLGDGGVGKSSLIRRYVTNVFSEDYQQTLGTRVSKKELVVPDPSGKGLALVTLSIWDLMGQERLPRLVHSYLGGAHGVFLVVSLADPASVRGVEEWARLARETVGGAPRLVLGNKSDLGTRAVSEDELADLGERLDCDALGTSAKSGNNVEAAFSMLVREMLTRGGKR